MPTKTKAEMLAERDKLSRSANAFRNMSKGDLVAYWNDVNDFSQELDRSIDDEQWSPQDVEDIQRIRDDITDFRGRAEATIKRIRWYLWDTKPEIQDESARITSVMTTKDEVIERFCDITSRGTTTEAFANMQKSQLAVYWSNVKNFLEELDLISKSPDIDQAYVQSIQKEAQLLKIRAENEIDHRRWYLWDAKPKLGRPQDEKAATPTGSVFQIV